MKILLQLFQIGYAGNISRWYCLVNKNKKKQPESSDDSFDYDQGYNIEEVYDQ